MLLVREMAHRAGNMLQLVSSIAAQTFSADMDAQLAKKAFSNRLSALGRSNYVVFRGGWTLTRFSELVEEALKPFGNRIAIHGRDILLQPELCFDMGLLLHELATNPMKYGTLGTDTGAINVKWSYDRGPSGACFFRFEWDDRLSNRQSTAVGSGFGSKLMTSLVEAKWNGVFAVSDASGYWVTLEIPIAD